MLLHSLVKRRIVVHLWPQEHLGEALAERRDEHMLGFFSSVGLLLLSWAAFNGLSKLADTDRGDGDVAQDPRFSLGAIAHERLGRCTWSCLSIGEGARCLAANWWDRPYPCTFPSGCA